MGSADGVHRGRAQKEAALSLRRSDGRIESWGDGERLHWHFDQTDFVTSIALRPSEAGGDFQYVPLIRSATDENYPRVKRLLQGSDEGVVRVPMRPGTLLLFEGRNSIHRVTPIRGRITRLVALLAYDTQPATRSSKLLQMARYG